MEKATRGNGESPSLDLPDGLRFAYVPIDSLQLLEKNARVMRRGIYMTLVDNLKKDGRLESVPLCRPNGDGTYKVLSGNHRIMAAKDAGVVNVPILILP